MKVKCLALSFIISFLFQIHCSFSQRENTYHIESAAIIGTEQTPFWMRANQWGAVPTKGQTLSIFTGVKSDYFQNKKPIQIGYGLNLGGFVGLENKAIIQEGYVKAKWKVFEAYAGRRKEIVGLVDSTISSGSYIWSGNALPLPKIEISIPEYTSFRKNGFFALKGNFAHGWYINGRNDATKAKLHQKSLYFRLGSPSFKMKLYAGFNHQAQWGGYSNYIDTLSSIKIGQNFGNSFTNYLAVVTGRSSIINNNNTALANDSLNRVGNHLGSLDVGIGLEFNKVKVLAYRQSLFEDGSLFYLNNITDGLHGLSFNFPKLSFGPLQIKKVVVEYLNTLSQGGPFNDNPNVPSFRGNDNYFNNGVMRDGWTYHQTSMGSTFILGKSEIIQNYFKEPELFIVNNRIQAFYLGMYATVLRNVNILSRYSYSKNWGNYGSLAYLNIKTQNSFSITADKPINSINGFHVKAQFSFDYGDIYNGNFAFGLGLVKTWGYFPLSTLHPTHRHSF